MYFVYRLRLGILFFFFFLILKLLYEIIKCNDFALFHITKVIKIIYDHKLYTFFFFFQPNKNYNKYGKSEKKFQENTLLLKAICLYF